MTRIFLSVYTVVSLPLPILPVGNQHPNVTKEVRSMSKVTYGTAIRSLTLDFSW